MSSAKDIDDLLACLHHVLLFRLHLVRLDLWSDKLANVQHLDLALLSFAEVNPDHALADIRERLQVPQSTLTSIVDRLEKRGLVRRTINPKDKRSYRIELTEEGAAIQREHKRVGRMITRKLLHALPTEEERGEFVELFRRIAERL